MSAFIVFVAAAGQQAGVGGTAEGLLGNTKSNLLQTER